MTSPLEQLDTALQITGRLVGGVRDEEWDLPTPCTEWVVRDVVGHMTGGNSMVSGALATAGGEGASGLAAGGPPAGGGDLAAAYQASGEALRAAASRPGVLERPVTLPFATFPGAVAVQLRVIDLLTHGWDLGQALGRPIEVPEELAGQALEFSRSLLASLPPGAPFSPPQPAADSAPGIDRLAAFLGRPLPAA